jgi:hypothetical protein
MMFGTNRTRDRDFNNSNHSASNNASRISAIGEKRRLKLQFIQNNPNAQPNTCNYIMKINNVMKYFAKLFHFISKLIYK